MRAGTDWTQQAYVKASNSEANDRFGGVALSGNTLVVGAMEEDSGATGVNGNQADNSVPAAGAAYVFVRYGTNWSQQAYLKASNPDANDYFGVSPAVSGDTAVIAGWREDSSATGINGNQSDNSAHTAGAAYVFVGLGPLPRLTAQRSGGDVRIAWPRSATDFVLEEPALLGPRPGTTQWSQVPLPYETNATEIFITVTAPKDVKFFRLRKP